MYVPAPVVQQLERLKEMNGENINVWDTYAKNAQIGMELDNNFGWLFKKRRI